MVPSKAPLGTEKVTAPVGDAAQESTGATTAPPVPVPVRPPEPGPDPPDLDPPDPVVIPPPPDPDADPPLPDPVAGTPPDPLAGPLPPVPVPDGVAEGAQPSAKVIPATRHSNQDAGRRRVVIFSLGPEARGEGTFWPG